VGRTSYLKQVANTLPNQIPTLVPARRWPLRPGEVTGPPLHAPTIPAVRLDRSLRPETVSAPMRPEQRSAVETRISGEGREQSGTLNRLSPVHETASLKGLNQKESLTGQAHEAGHSTGVRPRDTLGEVSRVESEINVNSTQRVESTFEDTRTMPTGRTSLSHDLEPASEGPNRPSPVAFPSFSPSIPDPSTARTHPVGSQPAQPRRSGTDKQSSERMEAAVHIGRIDVRVQPPVVVSPAPMAEPQRNSPADRLARGLTTPFGLRQS
jgi:hypothetical protein